jgi:potassium efflux system protein
MDKPLIQFFDLKGGLIHLVSSIFGILYDVWNYAIYTTTDKQPITIANVITGLILFAVGIKVARYLTRIARNNIIDKLELESNVSDLLESITHYTLIIFISLMVLDISHVPFTVFSFIGGTFAVSMAFGSRNIFNNLLSGLFLMVEQPIRVGDFIEIDKTFGKVIKIGARCVNIRTANNVDILVPNSSILENKVVNWTLNDDKVKICIEVPIKRSAPTRTAEQTILKSLQQNKDILSLPLPQVYFDRYDEDNLVFEVTFWIHINSSDRKKIISDLNHMINLALFELGALAVSINE